jgi:hypothetical protein
MPKSKPSLQGGVIVHRIELQEKERAMLETYTIGKTVSNLLIPVAVTAGVGAAAYISYKAFKEITGWGEDIVDELQELINTDVNFIEGARPVPAIEAVVGKKQYMDTEGNVYKNPFAGWPVLGSIAGSAINLEIAARAKLGTTKPNDGPNQSDAWDAYVAANPGQNLAP